MNLEQALEASGLFQQQCNDPNGCAERGRVIVAIAEAGNDGEIMVSVFCTLHVPGKEIAEVFG